MPRASAMRAMKAQDMQELQAQSYVVPAPTGGLNGRDALAAMPETDAVILDNWFPQPSWIEIRNGYTTLATFTGICETVAAYNALSGSNKLFAAAMNGVTGSIYRVDNAGGGSAGSAVVGGGSSTVQAITNAQYDWAQFGTGSAEVLYLVNGADPPLLYDGTTWWPISATTATITAITKASSAVVTINTVSGSNPFAIGNNVGFSGVVGMTQINGLIGNITATGGSSGAWTFTVNINSSGFGVYVSGGTVNQYVLTNGPASLSSLNIVVRYKSRLWFVQANTFNVYYLSQNTFAGALTLLQLGPNFDMGGYIQTVVTVSIDNSAGLNDYIAFISNQGEVVIYQGYDPASINTWYESAHFRIGSPVGTGRRAWQKVGSDAIIMCADGLVPMSKAMMTDRSQESIAVSDKIRKLLSDAVRSYSAYGGWQVVLYPIGNKILINVPTAAAFASSYQYVQNTLNGSWCTFGQNASSWGANCFEFMGTNLYFGAKNFVAQCDTGSADGTTAITARALPAFSYMGKRELLKEFTQAQPVIQTNGNLSVSISFNIDFNTIPSSAVIPISTGANTQWGASWGSPWGPAFAVSKKWVGLAGVGYAGSMQMSITANGLSVQWVATNVLYKPAGLFYG